MGNHLKKTFLALSLSAGLALPAIAGGGAIEGKVSATPSKYLEDTVVFLKKVEGKYTSKLHLMDQKGMKFNPRILAITAGDKVKYLNNDGVDHNVYTPDGDKFNLGMFAQGKSAEHEYKEPGTYTQLCSVHPEMLAYVFVSQNPYSATVDSKGNYKIDGVPPGEYDLEIWNAKLKAAPQRVKVEEKKAAKADFALAR